LLSTEQFTLFGLQLKNPKIKNIFNFLQFLFVQNLKYRNPYKPTFSTLFIPG